MKFFGRKPTTKHPGERTAADWYLALRRGFHGFAGDPMAEVARALAGSQVASVGLAVLIGADSRELVRVVAIAAAALAKHNDCVEPMIAALGDQSELVRRSAAYGLAMIGSIRGLAAVVSGTRHGRGVRTRAADLLKDMGPAAEPAIPHLVALLNDPDINWRSHFAAALALAAIGAPAVPYLVHVLEHGPSHARTAAAAALQEAGLSPGRPIPHLSHEQ